MIYHLKINVNRQGLHSVTQQLIATINPLPEQGLCTLFIQHTSASLLIQEHCDPSAQHDLEQWMNRLVPENDALYTHTLEGDDDMPAHIKSTLTATSLSIPITQHNLALGTWQGIFLWEHRHAHAERHIIAHILSD